MTEPRKTLTLKRKPAKEKLDITTVLSKKGRLVVPSPKGKSSTISPSVGVTPSSGSASVKEDVVVKRIEPKPAKLMSHEDAITLLTTWWPALFSETSVKPLKVGIRDDLRADRKARDLPFFDKKIRRALKTYTQTPQYLAVLITGAPRYDIQGHPVGIVSDEDASHAKERLTQIQRE